MAYCNQPVSASPILEIRNLSCAIAGRPVLRLNVATLGNITPQLHIHVVGRRAEDAAWPGPVWGHGEPAPYSGASLDVARAAALASLGA